MPIATCMRIAGIVLISLVVYLFLFSFCLLVYLANTDLYTFL